MRVTNSMLVSNYMNNLNKSMIKQDYLLNQMATNKKYAHISDNPAAYVYSQAARNKLNRLEEYQQNVADAQDWTLEVETTVSELNKILVNAYESSIDAATDVKSEGDRQNVSMYIKQLRDQLLTTLNSAFGDRFIFGGYNTTGTVDNGKVVPPFTVDPNNGHLMYNGFDISAAVTEEPNPIPLPADPNYADYENYLTFSSLRKDVLSFTMGPGIDMAVTFNGIDMVMIEPTITVDVPRRDSDGNVVYQQVQVGEERVYRGLDENGVDVWEIVPVYESQYEVAETREINNIYNLMDEFYQAVNRGDPTTALDQYITPLQNAQRGVLATTAEIGGRSNRFEMLASRYEDDAINYRQMQSDAEDADQAEVIMNFKMAEAVYKAALASGSYVIQPTLMDFLR